MAGRALSTEKVSEGRSRKSATTSTTGGVAGTESPSHSALVASSIFVFDDGDAIVVPVYGSISHTTAGGVYKPSWVDYKVIIGVPHDMPIVGYGGQTVNVLRLFSARSSDEFDIGIFNSEHVTATGL